MKNYKKLRQRIRDIKKKEYGKAAREFQSINKIQKTIYEKLLIEKDNIIGQHIKNAENEREKIIKEIEKNHTAEIEIKNSEISKLFDRIDNIRKEYQRKYDLLSQSKKHFNNYVIKTMKAVEKYRFDSNELLSISYQYDNTLKNVAQGLLKLTDIKPQLERKNNDLLNFVEKINQIKLDFEDKEKID